MRPPNTAVELAFEWREELQAGSARAVESRVLDHVVASHGHEVRQQLKVYDEWGREVVAVVRV